MCGVSEMVQRWQSVRDNLIILTGETMQEISKDIIGLVQDQLYEDGTDGNGEKLEEYREIAYSKLKFSMRGKSITDLYLTGAFQEAMILIIEGDSYTITSTDEKTKELEKKYGPEKSIEFLKSLKDKSDQKAKLISGEITKAEEFNRQLQLKNIEKN